MMNANCQTLSRRGSLVLKLMLSARRHFLMRWLHFAGQSTQPPLTSESCGLSPRSSGRLDLHIKESLPMTQKCLCPP
jgi:hypothetical protein